MSTAVVEAHTAELAGWDTGKGTVRFTVDHPLPDELVTLLVQARVVENAQAGAKKRGQNA